MDVVHHILEYTGLLEVPRYEIRAFVMMGHQGDDEYEDEIERGRLQLQDCYDLPGMICSERTILRVWCAHEGKCRILHVHFFDFEVSTECIFDTDDGPTIKGRHRTGIWRHLRYDADRDIEGAVGFVVGLLQRIEDPGRGDVFRLELENPKKTRCLAEFRVNPKNDTPPEMITTVTYALKTLLFSR